MKYTKTIFGSLILIFGLANCGELHSDSKIGQSAQNAELQNQELGDMANESDLQEKETSVRPYKYSAILPDSANYIDIERKFQKKIDSLENIINAKTQNSIQTNAIYSGIEIDSSVEVPKHLRFRNCDCP